MTRVASSAKAMAYFSSCTVETEDIVLHSNSSQTNDIGLHNIQTYIYNNTRQSGLPVTHTNKHTNTYTHTYTHTHKTYIY